MKPWTEYSGKPAGVLVVPNAGGWVRLDADIPDPAGSGLEIQEMYLNCRCIWRCACGVETADLAKHVAATHPEQPFWWIVTPPGRIRVRYEREGGDDTAYQDFTVGAGEPRFLITHNHSEAGRRGIGGRWWIDVAGGLARIEISTRYDKAGGVSL